MSDSSLSAAAEETLVQQFLLAASRAQRRSVIPAEHSIAKPDFVDQFRYACVGIAESCGWLSFVDQAVIDRYETSYSMHITAQSSRLYRNALKRLIDIFLVLLVLPIYVPLLLVIAVSVRVTSPGPVFFSHRRIRQRGAFFSMWKFRTMCVNSAEVLEDYLRDNPKARFEWRRNHRLRHDPRITPIGLFLRKYSLDELPQLWNIFAGDMSFVGPRPIVAAEVEKYGEHFADYVSVQPGLTGLWQVSGRGQVSYRERVHLDVTYAHRVSFLTDLRILLRSFGALVNEDGSF